MVQQFKRVPLGDYPELHIQDKVIYRSPPEYIAQGRNQIITLGKDGEDQYTMTFWTWYRDYRYKHPVAGNWISKEVRLNKKQVRALQRMHPGGLRK